MGRHVYGMFKNVDAWIYEKAACIAPEIGVAGDELEFIVNAFNAVRKYNKTCKLCVAYTPAGEATLYLARLGTGQPQKSPALDACRLWLEGDEERIMRLHRWLRQEAQIAYDAHIDSHLRYDNPF